MSEYVLECRKCGDRLKDTFCAFCEHCSGALLVTRYAEQRFLQQERESFPGSPEAGHGGSGEGIWRFNWLPVRQRQGYAAGPVVYRSEGLAARLGLDDLRIAFNGYWPERGAGIETCTFKEFEAAVVLANARENGIPGLVAASAGNTARAFAHLSHLTGFPVIIVVPELCLCDMWFLEPSILVPTVVITDGDYSDAIDLAARIARASGMPFEGGVRNVAKRDGLGIVLMEAVSAMGSLPRHYVQAVGSGAGAIAVWEMAERFVADGSFGRRLPVLHLAQNLPFAPMTQAWWRGEREMAPEDLRQELVPRISTRVLSNRYPAYSTMGGVFDALTATGGSMYGIENEEVEAAGGLFEEAEGIDIVPAAAVAVAALQKALEEGRIMSGEPVLLNITGGGERRIVESGRTCPVSGEPVSKNVSDEEIERLICRLLKKNC